MNTESYQPSTPTAELGRQLRMERERPRRGRPRGYRKTDVPKHICSTRTLDRIEGGKHPRVRTGLVLELCDFYGTDQDLTRQLKELAVATQADQWWDAYRPGMESWHWLQQQREEQAAHIKSHDSAYIPALVQHPDYVRAIHASMAAGVDWQKIDLSVAEQLKLERQQRWLESERRLTCIIGEAALLLNLGDAVMETQKQHLLKLTKLPHATILVAPLAAGRYDVYGLEFSILEFDDGNEPIICVGGYTGRYVPHDSNPGRLFREGFTGAETKSISIEEYLS